MVSVNDITKVESLQRSATKFILRVNWDDDIPYHDPLIKSNLLPLSYWHEYKDLLFYKVKLDLDGFRKARYPRITKRATKRVSVLPLWCDQRQETFVNIGLFQATTN